MCSIKIFIYLYFIYSLFIIKMANIFFYSVGLLPLCGIFKLLVLILDLLVARILIGRSNKNLEADIRG